MTYKSIIPIANKHILSILFQIVTGRFHVTVDRLNSILLEQSNFVLMQICYIKFKKKKIIGNNSNN